MSSQLESESEFEFDESELSEFLQIFSPISLHYRQPESDDHQWVFWSESEGSENNSSSADGATPIIHDKIKSALSKIYPFWWLLAQLWAPVTIGGRRLLSSSAQPFAVEHLSNGLAKYRLNSEKYKYNIDDENKLDTEPDQMIKSGGPATAFLNRRTSITKLQGFLSESDDYDEELNFSVMIPICFPSQSDCIGVLEFTFPNGYCYLAEFLFHTVKEIKEAGLDVFYVQHLIPYTTINGLKVVKDEIEEALKDVCESHGFALAQVWIPYEDRTDAFLTSSLEDTQTKQLLAIKLTGCYYSMKGGAFSYFEPYFRFGDVTPRAIAEEFPLVTLQDYKSRRISKLCDDMVMYWGLRGLPPTSALAICLRSNDTSDCTYVFEFMWIENSNFDHLDNLLLTLKRCLPKFKFASGVEIGNELDVHIEGDATGAELGDEIIHTEDNETKKFKIFQGNRSMVVDVAHSNVTSKTSQKAPEKGKNPMVVDLMAPSNVTSKTTPKVLPREVIEKQFGKTMKEAAKNLNVSISTLKRKFKELGIPEWPGPKLVNRNANGSSIIQSNRNEDDNEAIKDPSTIGTDKNILIFKAGYGDEMIKFHIPILQATLTAVETKIVMQLKLNIGNFKLKYRDEDEAWITLTSEESMSECIKRLRILDRNVLQLHVELYEQPTSPSSGSIATGTSSTFKGLSSLYDYAFE